VIVFELVEFKEDCVQEPHAFESISAWPTSEDERQAAGVVSELATIQAKSSKAIGNVRLQRKRNAQVVGVPPDQRQHAA
jgi:hypothetical protein